MHDPSFRSVSSRDRDDALATLVSAFRHDPVERWLYPVPAQYDEHFPRFAYAFSGGAFDAGTVWASADFGAVAMWMSPEAEPDGEAVVATLTDSVDRAKHQEMMSVLGQMEVAHPTYRHWYLPWLGVRTARQGTGLGGRLLAHGLDIADRSGLPVYLETPNPRTIPLYERHGFVVTGATTGTTCPPITFMSRAAPDVQT